jgi:hypothetical protein
MSLFQGEQFRPGSSEGYTFGQAPKAQPFVSMGIEPIERREKCYPLLGIVEPCRKAAGKRSARAAAAVLIHFGAAIPLLQASTNSCSGFGTGAPTRET